MRAAAAFAVFAVTFATLGAGVACASEPVTPKDDPPGSAYALFAGGCFWCMESDFEKLAGVLTVVSGYTGGPEKSPSYEQVSAHRTGHLESVRVVYDPKKVSYEKLVDYFFHHVDPTQGTGQFCDLGPQYRTAIFYVDDAQKKAAEKVKADIEKSNVLHAPIVTLMQKASEFWPAEGYHQDYYKKSPGSYHAYREGCGRDDRVKELWGATAK